MDHELISEHRQKSYKRFSEDVDHYRDRNKRIRYDYRCKSQYDDEYNSSDIRRRRSNSHESRKQRRSRSIHGRNHKKEFSKAQKTEIQNKEDKESVNIPPAPKKTVDLLTSRTGGAYIPPAKLKMMLTEITDKSSEAYQRIAWEALKKSIHGYINKVNFGNIKIITKELFHENIVRGRGLLVKSIIQAQAASPISTPVYAALASIINSKFPNIGELLLKRLVIQFKRGFRSNDKPLCISSGTFIAHLVNQGVAHEILALELLFGLIETPTDDSVEVAVAFLKECGAKLIQVSKYGIEAIFESLRSILYSHQLHKRVEYMIEGLMKIRKDKFKDYVAVSDELDLVEKEDQFTHVMKLDETVNDQDVLNAFKFDAEYSQNEEKYQKLMKEILGTDESSSDDGDEEDSSDESEENKAEKYNVLDNTETNLTGLRKMIYLTIQSSLNFEECAHKLMQMQLKPDQEIEICYMILDGCAEMRTYEKFFGLLAGHLCAVNKIYRTFFEQIFNDSYNTIHRLDMVKLRNVSMFFAHLLYSNSISWCVLDCISLNEEDTSSSRIFIKILFQELSVNMGLPKLNAQVKTFKGLFPRDDPKKTRFAIDFFYFIGLGGLTDDLRQYL